MTFVAAIDQYNRALGILITRRYGTSHHFLWVRYEFLKYCSDPLGSISIHIFSIEVSSTAFDVCISARRSSMLSALALSAATLAALVMAFCFASCS